jgi:uncharacterized protein (TIGR03435 family)
MLALCGTQLAAQTRAPAFEVASVKANTSGRRGTLISPQPGGRFVATNVSAERMIAWAYDLSDQQLTGLPAWAITDSFDINAKAESATAPFADIRRMVQSLIVERFQLTAHDEQRDSDVYLLVKARADGHLGPQLRASDCPPIAPVTPGDRSAAPAAPSGASVDSHCRSLMAGANRWVGRGIGMTPFIGMLRREVGQYVVDRTGLSGEYDLTLEFRSERVPGSGPQADGTLLPALDAPSLVIALPEQLGLKLEPSRAPVRVMVVDHLQRPTED